MHPIWWLLFVLFFFMLGGEYGLKLIGHGWRLLGKAYEWCFLENDIFRKLLGAGALVVLLGIGYTGVKGLESAHVTDAMCATMTAAGATPIVDASRKFSAASEFDIMMRCQSASSAMPGRCMSAASAIESRYTEQQYRAAVAALPADTAGLPQDMLTAVQQVNFCD